VTDHDAQADAFLDRMFQSMLASMDTDAVELGRVLGYYDALAGAPATSPELADRCGTHERYTREWLEQQAVSGILEVDDAAKEATERRYTLPSAHAEILVDRDSLRYFVPPLQMAAAWARQLPAIAEAHRTGGGVSWDAYGHDMRESQSGANRAAFLSWLAQEGFPAVGDLHDRLVNGAKVADVGTGYGWSAIGLALSHPNITIDGFDVDAPSIEAARENASEAGVGDRVTFHLLDAAEAPGEGSYDLVTAFECIHDMPDPVSVLRAMRRLRAEDGTVVVMDENVAHEFTVPGDDVERLMYGYSVFVCLNDGMSTPGSVGTGTVMRPDTFRRYAREAGFADIEILPIDHDLWRFYRLVG
jgi:predicted O-methyltransferase YrrM